MAKISFNVDAYTAKLIGRENVSKLDGAILELVKNTYDADASVCLLYYEKSTETLYIGDNGTGMTTEIIFNHWMTIGASSKKQTFKTTQGRVQTGEKGIGRFALDRIADVCDMITVSSKERLLWSVDWNSFDMGKKITDITANLEDTDLDFYQFVENIRNSVTRKFIEDKFKKTGTIFKLKHLRDSWDLGTIESIRKNLRTLIPPEFKEVFNIYFFEESTCIEDASILQEVDDYSFDYRIDFNAQANGNVEIQILRDEFDFMGNLETIMDNTPFTKDDYDYFLGKEIIINTSFSEMVMSKTPIENTIGEFRGRIYFSKLQMQKKEREKYYYKDITGRVDIRDSFGGIRIYRDGFRVRPYGEPKTSSSDWLLLAMRKNKSPAAISHKSGSWRVNADQMHGSVYISRTNLSLPDQSNRQGLVETREFALLRNFIENVIKFFERDRQYVCRILDDYYNNTHPIVEFEHELSKKIADDERSRINSEKKGKNKYQPSLIEVSKVSDIIAKKDNTISELENEIKMLRVLATTGIVTNTYVHEIKDLTHKLNMKIIMAKEALEFDKDIPSALEHIQIANDLRDRFNSWFKVTIESVRRDKRRLSNVDVRFLLKKLISAWQETLKPQNIVINLDIKEVTFRCFPYEIESIVNNLIANSVASFEKTQMSNKEIILCVEGTENNISITYQDTGCGLSPGYKKNPNLILDSFESDKLSTRGEIIGTGMGMWIIKRTVMEYNGIIDLSKNITAVSGFHVKIELKSK